jgi:hypothetical protein
MRKSLVAAAVAAVVWASPAHATQGLSCRPASGEVPRISLVIGAGGIVGASLDEGSGWISTMALDPPLILAQAWIDREQVLVDILSPGWDRVAQLRVRFERPVRGRPQTARGTLTLRGRTVQIRCQQD